MPPHLLLFNPKKMMMNIGFFSLLLVSPLLPPLSLAPPLSPLPPPPSLPRRVRRFSPSQRQRLRPLHWGGLMLMGETMEVVMGARICPLCPPLLSPPLLRHLPLFHLLLLS